MRSASRSTVRRLRVAGGGIAVAVTLVCSSVAAHATDYNEGAVIGGPAAPHEVNDLSSSGSSPTNIGSLTLGSNVITGATIPYGPITNAMTGERQYQDNDYVTFSVPSGDVLAKIILVAPSALVPDGSVIQPGDLFFAGIASGTSVSVTPPSSAGLLGYTLLSSGMVGSDILGALGMSSPPGFSGPPFSGATTFTGALPAGTYSLWLLDGDNPVSYKLDLQVTAVPEPAIWAMMLMGFGMIAVAMRYRKRRTSVSFA